MNTQHQPIRRQPNPPISSIPTSAPSTSTGFIQNSSSLSYSNIYTPRPSYAIGPLYNFTATTSEQSPSSLNSYPGSSNHSTGHHYFQDSVSHAHNMRNARVYTHAHVLPPPPRQLRPLPAVPISAHIRDQSLQSHTSTQPSSAPASTTAYNRELIHHYKSGSYASDSSNMSYLQGSPSIRPPAALRHERNAERTATYPKAISEIVSSLPDGSLLLRSVIAPSAVTRISAAIAAADGGRDTSSNKNFDRPKRKPVPIYEANESSSTTFNRDYTNSSLPVSTANKSTAIASTSTPSSKSVSKSVTRPTLSTLQIPQTTSAYSNQNKQKTTRPSRSHSSLIVQPPSSPTHPNREIDPRSPKSFRTTLSLTPTATPALMSRAISRCSSASSLHTLSLTPTPSLFPLPPPTSPNTLMKAWELLEPKIGGIGLPGLSKPQSSFINENQDVTRDKSGIELNDGEAYLFHSSSSAGVLNSAVSSQSHVRSRFSPHSKSRSESKSRTPPQSNLQTLSSSTVQTYPVSKEPSTPALAFSSSILPNSYSEADQNLNRLSVPMSVSSASISFVTAVSNITSNSTTSIVNIKSKIKDNARSTSYSRTEDDASVGVMVASSSKLEPDNGKVTNISDNSDMGQYSTDLLDKHSTSNVENVVVNKSNSEEKIETQDKPYKKASRSDGTELKLLNIVQEIPCPPLESEPLSLIYDHYGLIPAPFVAFPLANPFDNGILTLSLQYKEELSDFVPKVVELRTLKSTISSTGAKNKKLATRIIAAYDQDAQTADVKDVNEWANSTDSRASISATEKTKVVDSYDGETTYSRTYKVYLIPINDDTWEERLSFTLPSLSSTCVTSPTSPPSSSSSSSPSECSVILPVTLFPAPHAPSLPLLLLPALGLRAPNGIAAALLPIQVLAELPASVNVLADVFAGLEIDEKEEERRRKKSRLRSKRIASAGDLRGSVTPATGTPPTMREITARIDSQTSSQQNHDQKDISLSTPTPSLSLAQSSLRQSDSHPKLTKLESVSQAPIHSRTNSIHGPRPRPASRGFHAQASLNPAHNVPGSDSSAFVLGEAGPRSPPPSTPGTPTPVSNTAKTDLEADESLKMSTDVTKSRVLASVPENSSLPQGLSSMLTDAGRASTGVGDTKTTEPSDKHAKSPLPSLQHRSSSSSIVNLPQTAIEERVLPAQFPNPSLLPSQRRTVLCTLTTQNFGLWTNSLVLGVRDTNVIRLLEIAWGVVSEAGKISSERKPRRVSNTPLSPKATYNFPSGAKLFDDTSENMSLKTKNLKYTAYSIEYDEEAAVTQDTDKVIYPPEDTSSEQTSIALAPRPPTRDRAMTIIAKRPAIVGAVTRERDGTITRRNTLVGPRQPPRKSHSRSSSANIAISNLDNPS